MKPGDLVAWTEYAAGWSGGPKAGEYAGTVVRVIPRISGRVRSRPKIEILDTGLFIVGPRFVEVISES